ncbi:MAG TPA: hypothetical protein PK089_03215 [Methanoregulaceae archaeon]|nr:hypothetical protein [Methanoregulaceae archaeon]HQJ88151.1 hypothetical protein [Methanoregulaceae archaeon]
MASKFGRGFVTNLMQIERHLCLPPEQAFYGLADHLDELILPERFRGTEVEDLLTLFRKRILWHQAGTVDREELPEIKRLFARLCVTVDRELGIEDAAVGSFE